VQLEGLGQLKSPVTPSRVEPTAFRLVAQNIDQLRKAYGKDWFVAGETFFRVAGVPDGIRTEHSSYKLQRKELRKAESPRACYEEKCLSGCYVPEYRSRMASSGIIRRVALVRRNLAPPSSG
jgi:hypothetical protein